MINNDLPCPKWKTYFEILANVIKSDKTLEIVFVLSLSLLTFFFVYLEICKVHQCHVNS